MTAPLAEAALRGREVVTPEGVPVRFVLATGGDRAGAFVLDLLFMAVGYVLLALSTCGVSAATGFDVGGAYAFIGLFLVGMYFVIVELAWKGQTLGKRLLKLRTVDAHGGPLTAEALIARNLMREIELWLPAKLLVGLALGGTELIGGDKPGLWVLGSLLWIFVCALVPLFNKDRLRIGDLVAGTVVIRRPAAPLLVDLTTSLLARSGEYVFTEAQLDVYGAYELQVLESVLRGLGGAGFADQVRTVAEKIRARIGWEAPVRDDVAFLRAFYAAQRGRLERRMLFGKRRASKHDRT
jgi:uncharacterized RDD family membrane protein YckC